MAEKSSRRPRHPDLDMSWIFGSGHSCPNKKCKLRFQGIGLCSTGFGKSRAHHWQVWIGVSRGFFSRVWDFGFGASAAVFRDLRIAGMVTLLPSEGTPASCCHLRF